MEGAVGFADALKSRIFVDFSGGFAMACGSLAFCIV